MVETGEILYNALDTKLVFGKGTIKKLPTRIRDSGIPRESLRKIAEHSWSHTEIISNPKKIRGPKDINEILSKAW